MQSKLATPLWMLVVACWVRLAPFVALLPAARGQATAAGARGSAPDLRTTAAAERGVSLLQANVTTGRGPALPRAASATAETGRAQALQRAAAVTATTGRGPALPRAASANAMTGRRPALPRAPVAGVQDVGSGGVGGGSGGGWGGLPCAELPADVCTTPINPTIPQPCYLDPSCSAGEGSGPRDVLGCNAGGAGQACRYCGFQEYNACPGECLDFHCPAETCPQRRVKNDAQGSACGERSCRAEDPWCPNCRGQNFSCMAGRAQVALGTRRALGATYNNFALPNTGFCAMQRIHSESRSKTLGPRLLTQGLVFSGVGLSQAQFGSGETTDPGGMRGDGAVACGMCLEVTAPLPQWNCELTAIENTVPVIQKLIVMVMDQCNDQWTSWSEDGTTPLGNCVTGHLDFDVYTSAIGDMNIRNVTWRAVDCPVGDLPITVVFSSGNTAGSGDYFAFHLWDLLVPVAEVEVQCQDGRWAKLVYFPNGFNYVGACGTVAWPALPLRLTSVHGEVLNRTLAFDPASLAKPSQEDIVYLPPISFGSQFTVSFNPPSADANAHYKDCAENASGSD